MRNLPNHVARVGADDVAAQDLAVSDTDLASYLMFPKVFKVFFELDGQPRTVRVPKGEPLRSMEVMKMETMLSAERDATVTAVHVRPGDVINAKDLLLELG